MSIETQIQPNPLERKREEIKNRLDTARSLGDVVHVIDDVTYGTRRITNRSIYDHYKSIAEILPSEVPASAHRFAASGILSQDQEQQRQGKQALVFLHMGALLTAIEPYIVAHPKWKDDTVQIAVASIYDQIGEMNLDAQNPFSEQLSSSINEKITDFIAKQERLPQTWVAEGKAHIVANTVDKISIEHPAGLDEEHSAAIVAELREQTGYPARDLSAAVDNRNRYEYPEVAEDRTMGNTVYELPDTEGVLLPIEDRVQNMLDLLTEREAGIVTSIYGLNGLSQKTHEEIGRIYGVSRSRIGKQLEDAYRKLRGFAKRGLLRKFDFFSKEI